MEDQRHGYGDDGNGDGHETYEHIFRRLIVLSQASYRTMQEMTDRLSQEILTATDRRASLSFSSQTARDKEEQRQWGLTLPVCSPQKRYGTLHIVCQDGKPALPALPHSVASLLAEICGTVLHTCEITIVIQQLREQFDLAACRSLTKREEQVLNLMGQRLSDLRIAQALFITVKTIHTYQQKIYSKFGVHGKQEAILVGWLLGLLSPPTVVQI